MDGAHARTASSDGGTGPSTSYSSADADDNGGAGGAKVWVLVLLFSLLVLLLLPSAVRRGGTAGGGGFQRGGITIKSGWDVVNFCLVLFAILCGLLGRGSGAGDGDGESPSAAAAAPAKSHREVSKAAAAAAPEPITEASTEDVWASFNNSYSSHSAHTTGIRRLKSSSSYPELRLGSDGAWGRASPELAWRPYDDADLYPTRRDERLDRTRDADRPALRRTTSDVNTIPVDKYEVRTPHDARRPRRSRERLPKMAEVEEEERMHLPTAETPATRPARSRTWSPEELDATLSEAVPAAPPPHDARRRRRSRERLPRMAEVEEERMHLPTAETPAARPARSRTWSPQELDATLSEAVPVAPPPPATPRPRRRRHSSESLPTMEEVEKEIIVEQINNPLPSSTALFPLGTPPPPPPPPPPPGTLSRSKKKRSGSVGGAKELASAIALFYQKKRKSIIMKRERHHHHHHHHHLSDDHYSSPSSEASASPEATVRTNPPRPPPPPPPPPPPSSIFSNLFKKGGSKSRHIHSFAPPKPPPPPPPARRSRKPPQPPSHPAPTPPPPAPVRTWPPRAHLQQSARAQGYPQQPPMYHERGVIYYAYPLPPPSPPMPPPPPPPPLMSEGEEEAPSVTASPAPSYCASPDVNTKADNFIERFRAGLKLEKINSYREKLQIQEGATVTVSEEDGEFMVIGSLFEDDDDMSLPETPATAAVGY